jgi:hypothetical protein
VCEKERLSKKRAKKVISRKWRGECRYYYCRECNCYHVTSELVIQSEFRRGQIARYKRCGRRVNTSYNASYAK